MSSLPRFEVRNLRFDTGPRVPRHWHGNQAAVTSFLNNLSVLFPPGERFFIASVKAHLDAVTDPELLAAVRIFTSQEGMHSREHMRYNRMLHEQGYPVREMEQRVTRLLRVVSRLTPARWQLAATCALEHFTALMGQFILEDPRLLDGAHPTMARLWRWHAAEEVEHRSVAFDVYVQAGGNAPERAFIMVFTALIFWAKVVEQQARMMAADGILLSAREWTALLRFLFFEPGGMFGLARRSLAWFQPGFHPSDLGDADVLTRWIKELDGRAGEGVTS